MGKNIEDDINKDEELPSEKDILLQKILSSQNIKGRNLVQIRADKERKKGDIRNAFNKWYYICKILNAQDKLNEDYKNKEPIAIKDKNVINKDIYDKDLEKEKENNLKKIKDKKRSNG